jgi:nitrite reductase/ring-hydroxylating ferredoxin subunit
LALTVRESKLKREHVLCRTHELPPGEQRLFVIEEKLRVLVICVAQDDYRALYPRCPHRAAPLEHGEVMHAVTGSAPGEYIVDRDRVIIHCPWHGYDFDVVTGACITDPARYRVRTYEVNAVDGNVVLSL